MVTRLTVMAIALCAIATSAFAAGESWRYYRVGNTGIQGDYCDALWIGPDGDPWIGGYDPSFEEGGIAKFVQSEDRWINVSNVDHPVIGHPQFTGTTRVADIVADDQGTLWMGTGTGALKYSPATGPASLVRYTSANSTLPGGWTTGVERAPDGTLWFSAYGTVWGGPGLARYNPATNAWSSFGNYGEGSLAVQPKATSGFYVWTKNRLNGKAARWDSGTQTWTEFNAVTDAPWTLPGKACTDASGNTWMYRLTGASYALTRLDCRRPDGTWIGVPLPTLPAVNPPVWAFRAFGNLQALLVDGNSVTWRFNGTSWTNLGQWRSGAYTEDVAEDAAGNVWVCGTGGAAKRVASSGVWQRYRITNTGQFDDFTQDLALDAATNDVYVGANAGPGVGGMTRFDGARWTGWNNSTYGLGHDWPFPNDNCQTLAYRPSNGRIVVNPYWSYGIHEWDGASFGALPPLTGAQRMSEDSMGRLWAIGEYYSLQYHDGTWHSVPIAGWGASVRPDPSRAGTVWASTGYEVVRTDGTYRFARDVSHFPELTTQSDQLTGVVAEPSGIAWIGCTVMYGAGGTGGGLIRLDPASGQYTMMRYDQGWPFPGKFVVPLAVTPDGRLWLQYDTPYPYTERGLCWYDGTNVGAFPAPVDGGPQWGGLPHAQIADVELRVLPQSYELWMACVSRGVAVLSVPFDGSVAVDDAGERAALELAQNVPNPLRASTRIAFTLPRAGHARLGVYDVAGRLVRTLADREYEAGPHALEWDARDAANRPAPSGVYFYRLERAGETLERKLVVLD